MHQITAIADPQRTINLILLMTLTCALFEPDPGATREWKTLVICTGGLARQDYMIIRIDRILFKDL